MGNSDSIKSEFYVESDTQTTSPWKGVASYNSLIVNGKTNKDAAKEIAGYFAFWKGVKIENECKS